MNRTSFYVEIVTENKTQKPKRWATWTHHKNRGQRGGLTQDLAKAPQFM